MDAAIKVSYQVVIIFIYIILGYLMARNKKITEDGAKQMTSLLLMFVTPCVLIESYQNKIDSFSMDLVKDLGISALLTILFHIIGILLATLIYKREETGIYKINIFASVYSNCGFMAIPLLKAVLGDDGVFYGSAYLAMFTILTWTHGIYVFSGSRKSISAKSMFINPGVIGAAIALSLFLFKIKLPSIGLEAVGGIASLNTPLSMIVLGTYLANINAKKALSTPSLYSVSALRLIVIPLLSLLLVMGINIFYPIPALLSVAVLIPAACPSAAIAALFSSKYGNDAEYASEIVAINTLLSIITIPFIIWVSGLFLK